MQGAPEHYCGAAVPLPIRHAWRSWEAAEWRTGQHVNRGNLYPPDQRFTVSPPAGMCPHHHEQWQKWRDRRFKGHRFHSSGMDMGINRFMKPGEAWDFGRCEWDELTIEQMRLVEDLCLSGRSTQCDHRAGECRSGEPVAS